MKKILILSLTLVFAFCGVLYAAGINGQYHGKDIVRVTLDGKEVAPDNVPGYIDGGSTMIPLGMMRKMGFTVDWNAATKTANVTTKKPESTPKTALTMEQIKGLSNAVAIVYALDDNGKRWRQGSGFIINSHGLMISAFHVVNHDDKFNNLEVEVNGKTYKVPAGVNVFADKQKDIFGVYLQDSEAFPYLKVNEELPKSFETVYAIGNPQGRRNEVSEGSVTAAFKSQERTFVNGTFKTEGGFSGGPLVDSGGQVVGVITDGFDSGVSFSTSILEVIDEYNNALKN